MFQSKLKKVMGKVDGFIADLQAGIDNTKQQRCTVLDKIDNLQDEAKGLSDDIKAGQTLLDNLTKLKG